MPRHPDGAVPNERGARPGAGPARLARDAMGDTMERRRLEQELRHTLSQDGFVLHYLPAIALASGAIAGGEALIRWPHRKRGMVAPGLFLPVAERSALGSQIGGWVLRTACIEAARWPAPATVAVNVSPRHLAEGALLEHVAAALQASGLAAERLELEFPEPALLDLDGDELLMLAALRDLGIGIAFENFGAGYASLTVLRRLPLTGVKLDRALIRGVPDDPDDAAIVRALVGSFHALGLKVAATGIEAEAQRDFLRDLECDEGQGHLFSQALASEALCARLQP
jgi:EAL domain-containing protein (putative c-di-GMP-specific phosphodiesterase class I)